MLKAPHLLEPSCKPVKRLLTAWSILTCEVWFVPSHTRKSVCVAESLIVSLVSKLGYSLEAEIDPLQAATRPFPLESPVKFRDSRLK